MERYDSLQQAPDIEGGVEADEAPDEHQRNCEANASVYMELSALYWTQPVDNEGASAPRLTLLARFVWVLVTAFVVVMYFMLYTFLANWDPTIWAVAWFTGAHVLVYLYHKLLETTHPADGGLVAMCGCHEISGPALAGLAGKPGCWKALKAWPILSIRRAELLGVMYLVAAVVGAYWCLTVDMMADDPSNPSNPFSEDPTDWGGHAGSTFARLYAATGVFTFCATFSLVLVPTAYAYCAVYVLASEAIGAIVEQLRHADERLEPLSEQATKEAGRRIQILQETILEPLANYIGPAAGALVGQCMVSGALSCSLLASPNPLLVYTGVVFVAGFATAATFVLFPLAMITAGTREILTALNQCRTIGHGSGYGIVDANVNARVVSLEDYLLRLNDYDGPGAVICGQLISTKLLAGWLMSLVKYGAIGVPLILKFQGQLNADYVDALGSSSMSL